MTPEERFHEIEKLLQATAEQQARQQEQLGACGREIERQNEAIRSLIVVARTVLDSIKEDRQRHERDYEEMRAQSKATEEKLNILVNTVDRIIRYRDYPPYI